MMSKPDYLRIIIIDDNSGIHQDFTKILIKESQENKFNALDKLIFNEVPNTKSSKLPSFQIANAYQGQEGLLLIEQGLKEQKPFALAFVDLQMPPGWDGIETIQRIWEIDPYIQIVICTAYSDYTWEETVEKLGINDNLLILKKPFDPIAVRQLACALTKKWQLMQNAKSYTDYLELTVQERTYSLEKSLSLTRATLESSYNGIVIINNAGELVDYNSYFVEMWEIPPALLKQRKYEDVQNHMLLLLHNPKEFLDVMNHHSESVDKSDIFILKLEHKRFFEFYSQPHIVNDCLVGRVWSFRDITQRAELEKKLEHQASHDSLTSLPNRSLLLERIQQGIARAARNHNMFILLFIDLDRFKLINDSFSHETGDNLLIKLANRLRKITRGDDTIARLSGNEFIALSSSINRLDDAVRVASKILKEINKSMKLAKRSVTITASIGISIYPQDGSTPNELLHNAELAMNRSKSLGGNQFNFYRSELNASSILRFEQESELRRALIKNEFFLEYQPQYDWQKNEIVSVEALIRWQHPKLGVIPPLDFIPLAEDTSLIVPIGEWVIREACNYNKRCQDKGLFHFRVAVNVATKQFMQPNLTEIIKNILIETGLEPKYLEIEITENVIISNLNVIDTIKNLKALGVCIVLDDFGTGNSGLNYLRDLPVDRLKIDKSFVQNIDFNRSDEVIIQAIIAMAESLSLEVLAEGVETENQIKFLESQNCNNFQGFYFSKPVSEEKLEQMLKKNS